MIFVTVGTELPFDRLIRAVDTWARNAGRRDVFAQIGEADYLPSYIQYSRFLKPEEFTRRVTGAQAIVAHAGMGSILTALSLGKPILVMPRRMALGEHRSEHQVATANHMLGLGKVHVAFDGAELERKLDALDQLHPADRIAGVASDELVGAVRGFIRMTVDGSRLWWRAPNRVAWREDAKLRPVEPSEIGESVR